MKPVTSELTAYGERRIEYRLGQQFRSVTGNSEKWCPEIGVAARRKFADAMQDQSETLGRRRQTMDRMVEKPCYGWPVSVPMLAALALQQAVYPYARYQLVPGCIC